MSEQPTMRGLWAVTKIVIACLIVLAPVLVGMPGAHAAGPAIRVSGRPDVVYPNISGSTVAAIYCSSVPDDLAVDVVDADQQSVRQLLALDRLEPSSCFVETPHQVNWDGLLDGDDAAPDGSYALRFRATEDDGTVTESSVPVVVDTRIPAAPGAFRLDLRLDGLTDWTFRTTPGFELDKVVVNCRHDPALGTATTPTSQDVYSGTIDQRVCGRNESTELTAFWYDQFGNSHYYGDRTPIVYGPETYYQTGVTMEHTVGRTFSPDGDNQEDVVALGYFLRGSGRVQVTVRRDDDDRVLRTIDSSAVSSPGQDEFRRNLFDGRDDNGQLLPDGRYRFVVRIDDDVHHSSSLAFTPVDIDTSAPARMTDPRPGTTIDTQVRVKVAPAAGVPVQQVSFAIFHHDAVTVTSPEPDGTWQADFDTTSLAAGPAQVFAQVSWVDRFGQPHTWALPTVTVNVDHDHPLTIGTHSLPRGVRGQRYAAILQATGGSGSHTWRVSAGRLPSGLRLDPATGRISGTPRIVGRARFTVRTTDAAGSEVSQRLVLDVRRG